MIHIIQMIQTWHVILLMGEILHHLWCIKHCKWWDIYHINWCRISSINSIFAVICYFNFDLALPLTLNAASNTGTRYICSIYHYALSIYIYTEKSWELCRSIYAIYTFKNHGNRYSRKTYIKFDSLERIGEHNWAKKQFSYLRLCRDFPVPYGYVGRGTSNYPLKQIP